MSVANPEATASLTLRSPSPVPHRHREAENLPVDLAQEALHLVDERGMPFGDEVAAALGPDGEEIGMAVEQFLDNAGDVRSGPGVEGAVELFLGQRRESGQIASDGAGSLVEGEHGFEFVLELVAGAGFVSELEAERVFILADLADVPLIGELLAGAGIVMIRWVRLSAFVPVFLPLPLSN